VIPSSRCAFRSSAAEGMNTTQQKRKSICRANFDFLQSDFNCWKITLPVGPEMNITETHCQLIGFISGWMTLALTGNPVSWDVPSEKTTFFAKTCSLHNQTDTFLWLSALGHASSRLTSRVPPSLAVGPCFQSLTRQHLWQPRCLSPSVARGTEPFRRGRNKEKSLCPPK